MTASTFATAADGLTLTVQRIDAAHAFIKNGWATHGISLVDPGTPVAVRAPAHLVIETNDALKADKDKRAPAADDVALILAFTARLSREDRLVVHCHAGLGRSTAVAMAVLAQHGTHPDDAAKQVGSIRPWMSPNMLLLALADNALGLDDALQRACWMWTENCAPIPQDSAILKP